MRYETSIDIDTEIPDDYIIDYVSKICFPAQVFGNIELAEWAEENGYVKEEDES